ncbi:MAG: carbohydrate-binding domain-containing protein [Lachnospiraceae bacterium]|nr:carbohydrate-binding domain-containing protein [Lachnospiraceae bacterium]
MITNKKINAVCIGVIIFALVLTILFMNGESFGITAVSDGDREGTSDSEYFTANDIYPSWSTETASHITMKGTDGSVSGSGAYFLDGNLYIVQSGYYVITGELENGSIIVDASSKSRIWIMLNGVTVTASDNAAFRINQAKKVFLTLAEGTKNTFSDGKEMSEEALADGTNACVYVHDNLTINGSGQLTINGNYKNGITAKDNLVIAGGDIVVNAVGDGIRVNEKLKIRDTVLDVAAEDDGLVLQNNGTDNDNNGYIYVMSGNISIVSKDDAVNSTEDVIIDGGTIAIAAADDGIHSETNVFINDGIIKINECYEGIEALSITMTGGDVTIYPSDDGFNANGGSGDAFSMGGTGGFTGQGGPGQGFGDNTSDSENTSESDRPSLPGWDGSTDGNDMPTPPDRNESSDGSDMPAMPDRNDSTEETDNSSSALDSAITISGGKLTIVNTKGRDCDGLDSNGNIYISGGDIRISLPGSGTNAAIDYGSESGGVCVITGGTVVACGGSEMIESFDETSTQCSILYILESAAKAGSKLTLSDSSGNVLLEYDVPNNFTSVNISCPEMKTGETYSISTGDTVEEITQESTVTTFGDTSGISFGPGFPGTQGGTGQGESGQEGTGQGTPPDQGGTDQGGPGQDAPGEGPSADNSGDNSGSLSKDAAETDAEESGITEVDAGTSLVMVGASGGVMLLGLAFAMIYKRKEY